MVDTLLEKASSSQGELLLGAVWNAVMQLTALVFAS
jgi:hypothetical protein